MRKAGYALIECMIGMTILIIIITFVGKSYVLDLKMKQETIKIEKRNNIIDFIDKEIKYNMTLDDVKELLDAGSINIENNPDILENIKINDLVNLPEGEGISISKISEGVNHINYCIEIDGVGVSLYKSRWMDETS